MLHYSDNFFVVFSQKRAIKKQISIMAVEIELWTEEIDRPFKVWA